MRNILFASVFLFASGMPPAWAEEATPVAPPQAAKAEDWGHALEPKPIPDLPQLPSPEVVISLDGLTLHLSDRTTGFDKVYPIGVGVIRSGKTLTPTSESSSMGLYYANLDKPVFRDKPAPEVRWAWNYESRFWWFSRVKQKLMPVYAGLPFIRLESPGWSVNGIHGPAEGYKLPDGGRLRRGYVSHGCIRMEPDGILDLYARTRGKRFPIRIQREVERRPDGLAIDVADRWLLSECLTDADCNFDGGVCRKKARGRNGFCTAACEGECPDRYGYPGSFCVADPDSKDRGMCTIKALKFDNQCRRFEGFSRVPGVSRFGSPRSKTAVCLPGKPE